VALVWNSSQIDPDWYVLPAPPVALITPDWSGPNLPATVSPEALMMSASVRAM
jgi:hypothetical protein